MPSNKVLLEPAVDVAPYRWRCYHRPDWFDRDGLEVALATARSIAVPPCRTCYSEVYGAVE